MNKQKIALLTDSCADIPAALCKRYDIYVVPLKLIFSDGEYADGVDITPTEVYRRLPQEMPKTTLPSGASVEQVLGRIRRAGYTRVLAIHLSGGLSGTCNLVRVVGAQTEGLEIAAFDSLSGSLGTGMMVLQAARWIEQGWSWAELLRAVPPLMQDTHVFFCVQHPGIPAKRRTHRQDLCGCRHAAADQAHPVLCTGRTADQSGKGARPQGGYTENGANGRGACTARRALQSRSRPRGFSGRTERDPALAQKIMPDFEAFAEGRSTAPWALMWDRSCSVWGLQLLETAENTKKCVNYGIVTFFRQKKCYNISLDEDNAKSNKSRKG